VDVKEEVEQVLRRGEAPVGYVVRDLADGQGVEVEYPDDQEARTSFRPGDISTWSLSPGPDISRCDELLQLEGYQTELVPGREHHSLIIRGRLEPKR
jgi:hypothetical protein